MKNYNFTPEWAKKVIWYQIFPERFRCGDINNNPKIEDLCGTYPFDTESEWSIHPWTSDWFEMQDWEKRNFEKNSTYSLHKQIQRRRYGGDFQGIINKLDYLKDLGISAIYLNPVFYSPSSHKYDTTCYHHIDPHFGPNPEEDKKLIQSEIFNKPETWKWTSADLLALKMIEEIHKRDMYVIFDAVWNHCGYNNPAFVDLRTNQNQSKYKSWFTVKQWENEKKTKPFLYKCWSDYPELPEWRQNKKGLVKGPKDYIFAVTKRWMNPIVDNMKMQGIDGWRLDTALLIKPAFWKEWRKLVKSLNQEAVIIAETFEPVKKVKPHLNSEEFDSIMNYQWTKACSEFFIQENPISVKQFLSRLKILKDAYPECVVYSLQNLYDSHDLARIVTQIMNPKISYFSFKGINHEESKNYNHSKPTESTCELLKLMAIFQITYIGTPMIYYGTESGMWGSTDPCCRKPMVWDDLKYEPEKFYPDGTKKEQADTVEFNHEIFNHYKKLFSIRNHHKVFQSGDLNFIFSDNQKETLAFSRSYELEKMIIVINKSTSEQEIDIQLNNNEEYKDILNDNRIYYSERNSLKINLKSKWAAILKKI